MTTRQALVAAKEAVDGPWQRARNDERGVLVTGLGTGEVILMDYEVDRQLQLPIVFTSEGSFPFPKCHRFKFRKEVPPAAPNGVRPPSGNTFVEVIL